MTGELLERRDWLKRLEAGTWRRRDRRLSRANARRQPRSGAPSRCRCSRRSRAASPITTDGWSRGCSRTSSSSTRRCGRSPPRSSGASSLTPASRPHKGNPLPRAALMEAAQAATRRRDAQLYPQYEQINRRHGHKPSDRHAPALDSDRRLPRAARRRGLSRPRRALLCPPPTPHGSPGDWSLSVNVVRVLRSRAPRSHTVAELSSTAGCGTAAGTGRSVGFAKRR